MVYIDIIYYFTVFFKHFILLSSKEKLVENLFRGLE